jgi:hypothetical protein
MPRTRGRSLRMRQSSEISVKFSRKPIAAYSPLCEMPKLTSVRRKRALSRARQRRLTITTPLLAAARIAPAFDD